MTPVMQGPIDDSPGVLSELCVCVLVVFLFLRSIHHFRWGAAPNAHC